VPFSLERIVPWGRSFDEYVAMFALTGDDLRRSILACGDGPASFNSTLTKRGGKVVSADPIYQFSAQLIRSRIEGTFEEVIDQTRTNMDEFVWDHIRSVRELGRIRMAAMEEFLTDFASGVMAGRYIPAGLPELPFGHQKFDLALCSHFLFLYSNLFTADFHVASIKEMCRVAHEARIFPLLELGSRKSRHLENVIATLTGDGYKGIIESVGYEFQKGGNEMLRVTSS